MKRTKFYRRYNDDWKEDMGYQVAIRGWKNIPVFISGETGYWYATEGRSGFVCMRGGRSTIKEAIKAVKKTFDSHKDSVHDMIKSAIDNNGISPLYA